MTIHFLTIPAAAALILVIASHTFAQTLAQQSFDIVLEGDDPGESFTFDLPFAPTVPSEVRFEGFFENLNPDETGVRYALRWPGLDGGQEGVDTDFARLPGSGQLPLQFVEPVAFTPDSVRFIVQGGGPSDHFRFVGDSSIQQVPEPSAFALFGITIAGSFGRRVRSRVRSSLYGPRSCMLALPPHED